MLHLSQSDTTGILDRAAQARGLTVQRGWALVDIEIEGEAHRCRLRGPGGRTETVTARFVIGADGSNSRVREIIGARFDGAEQDETFIMADIDMRGFPYPPQDRHQFWLAEGTFFTVLPIDGTRFRLISTCRARSADVDEEFVLRRFRELLRILRLDEVTLGDPYWVTRFNPRQFLAENFRRDGIFLAGDAAHIQSPVGAQGLNTGIQDSVNLAWKLGLVLRAKADDTLLDSYHTERHPVARALFDYNNMLSARAFGRNRWKRQWLRYQNYLLRRPGYHATELRKISQFAVAYPAPAAPIRRTAPAPGERTPPLPLTTPAGRFDLLRELGGVRHVALDFAGTATEPDFTAGRTLGRYRELLGDSRFRSFTVYERTSPIQRFGHPADPHPVFDVAGRCRTRLGLRVGDTVLIRPDGHLAALADRDSLSSLDDHLTRTVT